MSKGTGNLDEDKCYIGLWTAATPAAPVAMAAAASPNYTCIYYVATSVGLTKNFSSAVSSFSTSTKVVTTFGRTIANEILRLESFLLLRFQRNILCFRCYFPSEKTQTVCPPTEKHRTLGNLTAWFQGDRLTSPPRFHGLSFASSSCTFPTRSSLVSFKGIFILSVTFNSVRD
ncbi:hypothetical protein HZH66_012076 [Vespula vulgaris]|uniref:Uncharacterized protein n=1 Tax=Vespula vulgaris TaxID=7454 RepID=A0A834MTU2_VESVU|nr:hypothetical protein HZH66_012076 [Vespula vulgaris]